MARAGRRPGGGDTRATILAAARQEFADHGYDQATVRTIAARAGVDPAMISHYFGGKEGLFRAAVQFPVAPQEILAQLQGLPTDQLGEEITRVFLAAWGSGQAVALRAVLRSALTHESAARLLRQFVSTMLVGNVSQLLPFARAESELRVTLAMSHLLGIAPIRYILRVEPIASLPEEELIALVAPTIQHYLTGDLTATR